MKYLTQNAKMKKSGGSTHWIFNWGIPAGETEVNGRRFVTCPWAGECAKGCYAKQGAYTWSNVSPAYQARLDMSLSQTFVEGLAHAIRLKVESRARRGRVLVIRIHDSGDFYNRKYLDKWIQVMAGFPDVRFYAYTKAIELMKFYVKNGVLPTNFTPIYSEGGTQDALIRETDRHSRVFESIEALREAGYDDATTDDSVAFTSTSGRIGLVYHGAKSKEWKTA